MLDSHRADIHEILETYDQVQRLLGQAATKLKWISKQMEGTVDFSEDAKIAMRRKIRVLKQHAFVELDIKRLNKRIDQHAQDTMHP